VDAGEILALLGPNGAGKTTTIRMLASILLPTAGTACLAGYDIYEDPVEIRRSVGLLTEHHGLYTRMRAVEYLTFYGEVYGMDRALCQRRIADLLGRFDLLPDAGRRLGEYSKGMRQKLALVRALLHDPRILLLDEPTSAMDPGSARLVRESIAGFRAAHRAIIVCTHNLTEAEQLADRIAIIRAGRIVVLGTATELRQSYFGDPEMELRVVGSLDGVHRSLPEGAHLVATGPGWLRYSTPRPAEVNPRVLRVMADAGLRVITLSEVGPTLEDVYLQAVGTDFDRGS
jgi:ABC-2 type transport system ATP-binding protein